MELTSTKQRRAVAGGDRRWRVSCWHCLPASLPACWSRLQPYASALAGRRDWRRLLRAACFAAVILLCRHTGPKMAPSGLPYLLPQRWDCGSWSRYSGPSASTTGSTRVRGPISPIFRALAGLPIRTAAFGSSILRCSSTSASQPTRCVGSWMQTIIPVTQFIHPDDVETSMARMASQHQDRRAADTMSSGSDGMMASIDGFATQALPRAMSVAGSSAGMAIPKTSTISGRRKPRCARARGSCELLVDTVPTMIWLMTPEGLPYYFNKRFVDWAGIDPASEEPSSATRQFAPHVELFHPDDRAAVKAAFQKSFAARRAAPAQRLGCAGKMANIAGSIRASNRCATKTALSFAGTASTSTSTTRSAPRNPCVWRTNGSRAPCAPPACPNCRCPLRTNSTSHCRRSWPTPARSRDG